MCWHDGVDDGLTFHPTLLLMSCHGMRRLESTSYTEIEKVAADVKLTFDNAILYNPPGQEIHKVSKAVGLDSVCPSDRSLACPCRFLPGGSGRRMAGQGRAGHGVYLLIHETTSHFDPPCSHIYVKPLPIHPGGQGDAGPVLQGLPPARARDPQGAGRRKPAALIRYVSTAPVIRPFTHTHTSPHVSTTVGDDGGQRRLVRALRLREAPLRAPALLLQRRGLQLLPHPPQLVLLDGRPQPVPLVRPLIDLID